jgi:hypothetical protein
MMNLLKVVVLFFFTTVAFAQGVVINYPQNGASVPAGQDLTVQVVRPVRIFALFITFLFSNVLTTF